jgi:TIR domain
VSKKNPFVFLSYTGDGQDTMEGLKTEFTRHGIEYWEWSERMIAGDDLAKFGRAVEGADFFVPIISPDYKNRPATSRELSLAFARELKLKNSLGSDFSFVLPLLTSELDDLPSEIKDRYFVRTGEEIRKAVQDHAERIMLKNNPYSFSNWPSHLLDEQGNIDALVVIGHTAVKKRNRHLRT